MSPRHRGTLVVALPMSAPRFLECVEQKIYNRAAAAEEASQVAPHDLRAPARRDGRCEQSRGNLSLTIEGFTRYECLKRAESNVDGLRIAPDTV